MRTRRKRKAQGYPSRGNSPDAQGEPKTEPANKEVAATFFCCSLALTAKSGCFSLFCCWLWLSLRSLGHFPCSSSQLSQHRMQSSCQKQNCHLLCSTAAQLGKLLVPHPLAVEPFMSLWLSFENRFAHFRFSRPGRSLVMVRKSDNSP